MSATVSAFDLCCDITLGHEGGYTNDPNDPGGETNWGVSKRAYPNLDIKNLTKDQAKSQVYLPDYWNKLSLDTADPAFACILFDSAVNNGVGAATKFMQQGLGVTADGVIGPATLAALKAATGATAQAALTEAHGQRIFHMAGLSTWANFGLGWSRRLAALPYQASQIALQMGTGGPAA
jgi:lysozyme family protein